MARQKRTMIPRLSQLNSIPGNWMWTFLLTTVPDKKSRKLMICVYNKKAPRNAGGLFYQQVRCLYQINLNPSEKVKVFPLLTKPGLLTFTLPSEVFESPHS